MSLSASVPILHIGRVPQDKATDAWHGFAWLGVLVGIGPARLFYHSFGINPGTWLAIVETLFLVCLAALLTRHPKQHKLAGFLLLVAAAHLAWDVVVPLIEGSDITQKISARLAWGGEFFLSRCIRLVGVPLLCATLLGSGIRLRDLFLRWGDWGRPVQPEPILPLKRPIAWRSFIGITLLLFGIVLPCFLAITLHPSIGRLPQLIAVLPWAVATSILNAANEEFQFRNLVLARLKNVVTPREAALLAGAFFGIGHFFGQPGGLPGVVMGTLAGWIWAKSMIETRGFACAFVSHFVQDIIIFGFLAMAVAGIPKG